MNETAKPTQSDEVVTGTGSNSTPGLKLTNLSKILLWVLLIIVVGSVFFYWKSKQIPQLSDNNLGKQVAGYSGTGQSAKAIALAKGQKKHTAATMMVLASVYWNEKKYQPALNLYQEAIKNYGDSFQLDKNAAELAELIGNKPLAATYYQKTINHISEDPMGPSDLPYYQSKLKALQT